MLHICSLHRSTQEEGTLLPTGSCTGSCPEYKFYQDRKVTSWERDYFSVKADSYEEAEAIVRSWNCEDVSNIIDNRLCYEEWQALTDTSESMLPEENDGNPTIEIFNQDGESIMTNVPETPQSNQ